MSNLKNPTSPRHILTNQNYVCDLAVYMAIYDTVEPGKSVGSGPLIRDFFVINYCTNGKLTLIVNGNKFDISPGQCYVIFPGDVVEQVNEYDKPCYHVCVSIYGTKARSYFNNMGITPLSPLLPWKENFEFLNSMREVVRLANIFILSTELMRSTLAYNLFNKLNTYLTSHSEHLNQTPSKNSYIKNALNYMEANCHQKLTVTETAKYLGLTRGYFSSLFKSCTGRTPQKHLIYLRINKACNLLKDPNVKISNVASLVGMDESLFFKQFYHLNKCTPAEYRNNCANHKYDVNDKLSN